MTTTKRTIAVATDGNTKLAPVAARFGRCAHFIVYDEAARVYRMLDNTQARDEDQGAGIQAAQNVLGENPTDVIVANCGPKAFRLLHEAGVRVYTDIEGTAMDAIRRLLAGDLQPAQGPNAAAHAGQ